MTGQLNAFKPSLVLPYIAGALSGRVRSDQWNAAKERNLHNFSYSSNVGFSFHVRRVILNARIMGLINFNVV